MNNNTKILITGANGLLGQKVAEIFARETEYELLLTDIGDKKFSPVNHEYKKLDITNKDNVKNMVREYLPGIIINTAAFTNVDGCETERELCWKVNVDAVKNLIIAARIHDCRIIHISTDYVFDGIKGNYDESSAPNPRSFYGKSKLASENALRISGVEHAIVRTMILYGTGNNIRPNFALWMINSLESNQPIKIVTDQFGQPTLIDDLAVGIMKIAENNATGIFHICGSEYLSRYDFALKLAKIFELNASLIAPIKTYELEQAADRPMNSSFVMLKAQSILGLKTLNAEEGLYMLKNQLGK